MRTIEDISIKNKNILIRVDFNVPVDENGNITNDIRIVASTKTIKYLIDNGANKIFIMSHFGRPKAGVFDKKYSLENVAKRLGELLSKTIYFQKELNFSKNISEKIILLENVRFHTGEVENDEQLSKKMAALCDIFVMDAFASAHRKHSSTYGVAKFVQNVVAGFLFYKEIQSISKFFEKPKKPIVAIVGGSKVSTKLGLIKSFSLKVDTLIVGGGIANTFIMAAGYKIGKSICDSNLLPVSKSIMATSNILIPKDIIVADGFSSDAKYRTKPIDEVADNEIILDIGQKTQHMYADVIKNAGTIIWNGPVGLFEWENFSEGTKHLTYAIADSKAFSIAGGGDTVAAIDLFNVKDNISYICTGGGAFLQYLEDGSLPIISLLQ